MPDLEPHVRENLRKHVKSVIHNRHHSDAWLRSPNRNPVNILAAYKSPPVRTKTLWRYDRDIGQTVSVETPAEYMYTADEMKAELNRKLLRAETGDPRAHPDYNASRFSVAELLEHVIPHLPQSQPVTVNHYGL